MSIGDYQKTQFERSSLKELGIYLILFRIICAIHLIKEGAPNIGYIKEDKVLIYGSK